MSQKKSLMLWISIAKEDKGNKSAIKIDKKETNIEEGKYMFRTY